MTAAPRITVEAREDFNEEDLVADESVLISSPSADTSNVWLRHLPQPEPRRPRNYRSECAG